jgi:hypothetical protein
MKAPLPTIEISPLPPLYAAWMNQMLAGPIPQETSATCDNCAMCSQDHRAGAGNSFLPETKCCTYVPVLANYLVGRILAEDDPASASGRVTVVARLRAGVGATPLGLDIPPAYRLLYMNSAEAFGRSQALRCPHYPASEGGRCGIWKQRAGICATWFCKHRRGAVGQRFWVALEQLLAAVERQLARWCVLEMEVGVAALRQLFPRTAVPGQGKGVDYRALDGTVDPAAYSRLWGNWHGRESEFYEACARRVNPLTWPEVAAIGGPEIGIFASLVQEAYQALLSRELPTSLRVAPLAIDRTEPGRVLVTSYRASDPLELPRALFEVLHYFDGRPTDEVLRAVRVEKGLGLNEGLVRKLPDFEILVPCEEGP